jgi:hypothetical protein
VHEEKVDIADVIDEERLVAGRHEVSCLLVRAITDLRKREKLAMKLRSISVRFSSRWDPCSGQPPCLLDNNPEDHLHTFGIAAWPLNLRRTRLSIPLGFLQLGSTHLKRSL